MPIFSGRPCRAPSDARHAVEVLVVDDGSTDATAEVAQAEQVCQVTADADQHGKLKGKRLTDAVDALNALGGTWQLAP